MSLPRRGLVAGAASLLGGCSPASLLNVTVARAGYTLDPDIAYGPLLRQRLDLYLPQTPRPDGKAVIFFYGGSWHSGSKSDYLFVAQALAARGIAVVMPDYRVYPDVRFPAFLDDAAQATRWAAGRLGVDKLFVAGHSAGGQIASMLAANTPYLARAGVDRMKLRGLIGIAGPYDFLPLTSARLIEIFGGANNPEIQAITFARAPLPPALLLHGTDDTTVLPRNSRNLAAAWHAAGASADLKIYSGVGHIDIVAAFAGFLQGRAPTREDVVAWIEAH
jgi:acetyl esterase/lipase